jgi:hypothetical protein
MKQDGKTWDEIGEHFGKSGETVRGYARNKDWYSRIKGIDPHDKTNLEDKEVTNRKVYDDGSIVENIERHFRKPTEPKTEQDFMELHGYDSNEFTFVNGESNVWTVTNAEGETFYNVQSKIKVKLIDKEVNWEEIGNKLAERVAPKSPKQATRIVHDDNYFVKNVFDPHFGNSGLEDYDESLGKDFRNFRKGYKKILIIAGGDLLHNDNNNGTTTKGTLIEKVDMNQAWEDAFDYFDMLLEEASVNAEKVELIYVPGNHDDFSGWTVIKALKRLYERYDNVTIDDSQQVFKATLLGHNFIGMTHGDKSNKNKLPMIFATYFAKYWGADGVYTREAYIGHLHKEETVDKDGLLIRQQPTRNKPDQWHIDNGFKSSHKRFLSVEYDEYEPVGFYYT